MHMCTQIIGSTCITILQLVNLVCVTPIKSSRMNGAAIQLLLGLSHHFFHACLLKALREMKSLLIFCMTTEQFSWFYQLRFFCRGHYLSFSTKYRRVNGTIHLGQDTMLEQKKEDTYELSSTALKEIKIWFPYHPEKNPKKLSTQEKIILKIQK